VDVAASSAYRSKGINLSTTILVLIENRITVSVVLHVIIRKETDLISVFQVFISALIYGLYFFAPIPAGWSFFAIMTLLWLVIFLHSVRFSTAQFALTRLLIYSIPVSFMSFTGATYGQLPISWFNIFTALFALVSLWEMAHKARLRIGAITLCAVLFAVLTLPALLAASDFAAGVKQYVHIIAFCLTLIATENLRNTFSSGQLSALVKDYLLATTLTAAGLMLQIMLALVFGGIYGHYVVFGGDRTAAGFLFSDFSFLALYLASGAGAAFALLLDGQRILPKLFLLGFLLSASVLTTARTGFVAFVLTIVLLVFPHFLRISLRKTSIVVILLGSAVLLGGYYMLQFRPEGFFEGSGRLANYVIALRNFIESPLYGVGLGVETYAAKNSSEIPHNLLLQFLTQTGVLGCVGLSMMALLLLLAALRAEPPLRYSFFVVLVGSMFVPDMINSRFFLACSVLVLASAAVRRSAAVKVDADITHASSALVVVSR
jgi:O-antigen ligase